MVTVAMPLIVEPPPASHPGRRVDGAAPKHPGAMRFARRLPWRSPVHNNSAHRHLSRVPRANIDPIGSASEALALVSLAIGHPLRHETVVIVLDDDRLGNVITVVGETQHADLCTIVETFCLAACGTAGSALVVATVRPDGATRPGDVDVWLEASALANTFDVELLEWFIIGPAGPECPRDLIGELERW